jgi:putative ABC transport system permease protein
MTGILQDLRFALRQLRKGRAFTIMAVLTLALGIATSTVIFGVTSAVLLQPLPFPNPDRLVRILSTQGDVVRGPSALDVRDFGIENQTFEQLVGYDHWRKNISPVSGLGEPEQLVVGLVPPGYFEVLGLRPLMGRIFAPGENSWGKHYETVVSYEFWQTRLGGDPSVLGKSIRINDEPYTIIGVMRGGIPDWALNTAGGKMELWTPFAPSASVWDESARGDRGFESIGRLKPKVRLEQARADLERIAGNLAARYPLDRGVGVAVRPLEEDRVGTLHPVVLLLMGAAILILLIACSNVANLLLARNSDRVREIAVRIALGAGKSALMRRFMAENLMLGLWAGGVGCALAAWGCAVVSHVHPAKLPQLATVVVDSRVLLFGLALSFASTVLFGTLPAWVGTRVNLSEALKEGGRAKTATRGRQYLRRLFVVSEMAFSVMLLVCTGLLVQSLVRLQKQEPGFRVDHLLRTHLYLPPIRYPNAVSITGFCDEYAARVRRLPGVQDVSISAAYPPDDQWRQNFTIENQPVSRLEDTPYAEFNVTDSHYIHALGIPLLQGRDFSDSDTDTSVPVVLVNQAFVNRYFPAGDAVGKQVRLGLPQATLAPATATTRLTIVGVIGNSMNRGLALPPAPQMTALYRQIPNLNYGFKNLIVRTAFDPLQLTRPIREQLRLLDPNLPFAEVSSMDEIMAGQTADQKYTTSLLALFAVFGMVLAVVGVYGVVSYLVTQRTNEIGLRMALGAQRVDVLWLIVKQGLGMAMIGNIIGLIGAWILRRTVAQLVFGISPADPVTFVAAAGVLIAFAFAASLIPARRAARVDPLVALRYE